MHADALRLDGRAVPCVAGDPSACALVGCGRPFPGHEVRVVGESDRPLPERHVVRSSSGAVLMTRYQQEPELSEDTLRGGWLRTGDLGYIADGDLFVCGRRKELVIVHGRNYYPQDLEWAAGAVAGVRRGSVVAFGLHPIDGPEERVVIVAECRGRADADRVRAGIIRAVQESCGLTVHDVVVVARELAPKTTSGKLQRARVKARYESGGLLPAGAAAPRSGAAPPAVALGLREGGAAACGLSPGVPPRRARGSGDLSPARLARHG